MKYFVSVLLAVYLLVACSPYQPEKKMTLVKKDSLVAVEAAKHVLACYEGMLPCADCGGINTTLTLREDSTYLLEERFTGTNDKIEKTFTYDGEYIVIKGTEKDADAVVYQLLFDDKENNRNYLVLSKHAIKLVDPQRREFETKLNYTLTKRKVKKS